MDLLSTNVFEMNDLDDLNAEEEIEASVIMEGNNANEAEMKRKPVWKSLGCHGSSNQLKIAKILAIRILYELYFRIRIQTVRTNFDFSFLRIRIQTQTAYFVIFVFFTN